MLDFQSHRLWRAALLKKNDRIYYNLGKIFPTKGTIVHEQTKPVTGTWLSRSSLQTIIVLRDFLDIHQLHSSIASTSALLDMFFLVLTPSSLPLSIFHKIYICICVRMCVNVYIYIY